MFNDINNSFTSLFRERLTSPLYGAFIASWLIWNWQIPYVTFFVSEDLLGKSKIEWIVQNNSDWQLLTLYPVLTTLFLIAIVPFMLNGAYWLSLKFRKWRVDSRNNIENKSMLTLEQSIALREELLRKDERLERMLENKNKEIKQLRVQLEELQNKIEKEKDNYPSLYTNPSRKVDDEMDEIVGRIMDNGEIENTFNEAIEYIQGGFSGLVKSDLVTSKGLAYLEANNVISSSEKGIFKLTEFGKKVLKRYLDYRQ